MFYSEKFVNQIMRFNGNINSEMNLQQSGGAGQSSISSIYVHYYYNFMFFKT